MAVQGNAISYAVYRGKQKIKYNRKSHDGVAAAVLRITMLEGRDAVGQGGIRWQDTIIGDIEKPWFTVRRQSNWTVGPRRVVQLVMLLSLHVCA